MVNYLAYTEGLSLEMSRSFSDGRKTDAGKWMENLQTMLFIQTVSILLCFIDKYSFDSMLVKMSKHARRSSFIYLSQLNLCEGAHIWVVASSKINKLLPKIFGFRVPVPNFNVISL